LPFGHFWYGDPNAVSNAIGYGMHRSRSHDAVTRIYDASPNRFETHEQCFAFKIALVPYGNRLQNAACSLLCG